MSSSKARENLTLELKIMSATDIRNVNIMSEMDVYALAWIDGEPNRRRPLFKSTPIAYSSGSNPTWNHHFKFSVNDRLALDGRLTLSVKPVSHRPLGGDRDIGQVDVPVLTLLLQNMPSLLINGDGAGMMSVSYPVRVVGGTKGKLNFSYRFVTADPGVNVCPPPAGSGHPHAPPPSDVYPPPPYPPVAPPRPPLDVYPPPPYQPVGPPPPQIDVYPPPPYPPVGQPQGFVPEFGPAVHGRRMWH